MLDIDTEFRGARSTATPGYLPGVPPGRPRGEPFHPPNLVVRQNISDRIRMSDFACKEQVLAPEKINARPIPSIPLFPAFLSS